MLSIRKSLACLGVIAAAALAAPATAQLPPGYVDDLDTLPASTIGIDVWDLNQPIGTPGNGGYYWPPGTTSVTHRAYTYAGNTLNVPQNPTGGTVFMAGNGPAGGVYARAQRDFSYGCGTGIWTAATDILVQFNGTLPTAQNIGSLSTQPFPGSQSFIMLARWTDINTAANWDADFIGFDAAGAQTTYAAFDPNFQSLNVNQWYRWETDFNLTTNLIVEIRVFDLTTATMIAQHQPTGWYMDGGSAGNVTPTGFRYFAGGGVAGNTIAWDNPSITPGKVTLNPGCNNPANSLTVLAGYPRMSDQLNLGVDDPGGTVTPGALAGIVLSLGLDPTQPCGTPIAIPGLTVTGNLLIRPGGVAVFGTQPWAGSGMPVTIPIAFPPALPVLCHLVGITIHVQGALLDGSTGNVVLTGGATIVLGG